jgi:superfamily I DNA/RNA helicase
MKLKRGITKLFGIPGSGKSTYQTEHIREGLMYGGIEGNLITSFSRGAVAELVQRNLKGVKLSKNERKNFGTLHSIC